MEYLIDTHILVWYLDGHPALSQALIDRLGNSDKIIVSIVSLWELTIKSSLGKIELNNSLQDIKKELDTNVKFDIINISFEHLVILSKLPHHHKDPFDRLLISQAISENLTIISADQHFNAYPVPLSGNKYL
jgi:PIN domain nuclease of toxin-antitoxin system